jgi:hypothetical protein
MIMRKGVIKEETLRLAFALVEWSLADIDELIKMRKKEVRQWKREREREGAEVEETGRGGSR